jgi:hypothetical protein
MAHPSRDYSPRGAQRNGWYQGRSGKGGSPKDDGYASDINPAGRGNAPTDDGYVSDMNRDHYQQGGWHQGRAGRSGAFTDDSYAPNTGGNRRPQDGSFQGREQGHPRVRLRPSRERTIRDETNFFHFNSHGKTQSTTCWKGSPSFKAM